MLSLQSPPTAKNKKKEQSRIPLNLLAFFYAKWPVDNFINTHSKERFNLIGARERVMYAIKRIISSIELMNK